MVVSLHARFNEPQIKAMLAEYLKRAETVIVMRLARVGELFVTAARSTNTYTDQTGNLRNSIGYIVLKDGEQLMSDFKMSAIIKKESKNSDGIKKGKELAEKVAEKFPKGFVLIVVAGMNYAAAVEAKGRDVLTGSSQQAIIELKKSFEKLKSKFAA